MKPEAQATKEKDKLDFIKNVKLFSFKQYYLENKKTIHIMGENFGHSCI